MLWCTLDCDAHKLAISVNCRIPDIVLNGLPVASDMFPAVWLGYGRMRILEQYDASHVCFVVRTCGHKR
jgi:hypothetical protein